MKSWLSTSSIDERVIRMMTAIKPTDSEAAGSSICSRFASGSSQIGT
jgi:hypothetical protein